MKWSIKHKYVSSDTCKYGDKKVEKHFCFFPKSYYDITSNSSIFYWLQYVYIVYEWTEGTSLICDFSGLPVCEPDYWHEIGIASTYKNAVNEIWK